MRNETETLELTEEQARQVEENHNLIYSFLHKHDLPEDYYSTAGIGLCKAAISFDESRGYAFSTFAYKCMYNECQKIWKTEKKEKAVSIVSLDAPQTEDEDDLSLMNLISGEDFIENTETKELLAWFIKDAAVPDLFVILRLLQKETQTSIAQEMGVTKSRVGIRVQNIRNKFREGRPLRCRKQNEDPEKAEQLKQSILLAVSS